MKIEVLGFLTCGFGVCLFFPEDGRYNLRKFRLKVHFWVLLYSNHRECEMLWHRKYARWESPLTNRFPWAYANLLLNENHFFDNQYFLSNLDRCLKPSNSISIQLSYIGHCDKKKKRKKKHGVIKEYKVHCHKSEHRWTFNPFMKHATLSQHTQL